MTTRNKLKKRTVENVRRERAPMPWQYCLLATACGVILAFGFFFVAKQHFSTIEFSMKNSEMRKAKEKLMADQRKLKAERDVVSSETNIERAGLKIGLRKFSSDDYQFIDAAKNVAPADNEKLAAVDKAKRATGVVKSEMARVTKTVSVRPAEPEKNNRSAKPAETKLAARDSVAALITKK